MKSSMNWDMFVKLIIFYKLCSKINHLDVFQMCPLPLNLPSLLTAWHFWTFHNKSHNMKALVILSHSWWPILPLTFLYVNKWTFAGLCAAFWSIIARRNSSRLHMQITWPWPPVGRFSHGLITVRQKKMWI